MTFVYHVSLRRCSAVPLASTINAIEVTKDYQMEVGNQSLNINS